MEEDKFKKIKEINFFYYSRKDVQQAIFDFCKKRETVPRYGEGFGKRPDILDFPSDLINYVKKGATSFHCSEEIWENPLELSRDLNPKQMNDLREGWDLLIDIDSKYFDYSKLAAELLIKALEYHGVKNIGIKFSGSKGLHLIVPWKSFPKEFDGKQTKEMFPEWPRLIASYLHDIIKEKLNQKIFSLTGKAELEKKGELISKHLCLKCGTEAEKRIVAKYQCLNRKCKSIVTSMKANRDLLKCPTCQFNMKKIGEEEIYFCNKCNINTERIKQSASSFGGEKRKTEENFKTEETTKAQQDSVDFVLVSPRHLFRCPYSLHEKTALSSVVIDKSELSSFSPQQADPLKVKIKPFCPDSIEGEAKELLIAAIDCEKKKEKKEKKYEGTSIDVKNLTIKEEFFPPCIKEILNGIKGDGRKRALFILLAFLVSLKFPEDYIEEKITEWNKKNAHPLKEGYVRSQIVWNFQNKIMPPNCNSHYYRDIGIKCSCSDVKNPVSYTIKQALKNKNRGK